MRRQTLGFLVAAVVSISGCGDPKLPPVNSRLLDPQGGFTLLVSNQSFAITPVDIRIEIDGETVVHEYFEVGNQHNWKAYRLSLNPGQHTLRLSSAKGRATLLTTFTVTGKHWAVVNYWYYPKSHDNPTPKHFSFDVYDRAPSFG